MAAAGLVVATLLSLSVAVASGADVKKSAPVFLLILLVLGWSRWWTRWRHLVALLLLIILFIPIKRYDLLVQLPFDLEPYRIFVAVLVMAWLGSLLLADPSIRLVKSGLEWPFFLIVGSALCSIALNPERVDRVGSDVTKQLTFFLSYFFVFYIIVSAVRTREALDYLIRFLVGGGAVIAVLAVVERRTGFNLFNHLSTFIPVLHFKGVNIAEDQQVRGGHLRVLGPSQHPIALSVLFVLLMPFAFYLARQYGRGRWTVVAFLICLGTLSTGSRTGIVGLLVLLLVYFVLQPRAVRRLWPALIPCVIATHFVVPGALGGVKAIFFPSGGLIADQSGNVVGSKVTSASGRLAKIGPALGELSADPVVGIGYGTRITTGSTANAPILDDQWLGTFVETGIIGVVAWVWLFVRAVRRQMRAARETFDDDSWLFTGFAAATAAFGVSMLTYDAASFIQTEFIFFIVLAFGAAFLNIHSAESPRRAEIVPVGSSGGRR